MYILFNLFHTTTTCVSHHPMRRLESGGVSIKAAVKRIKGSCLFWNLWPTLLSPNESHWWALLPRTSLLTCMMQSPSFAATKHAQEDRGFSNEGSVSCKTRELEEQGDGFVEPLTWAMKTKSKNNSKLFSWQPFVSLTFLLVSLAANVTVSTFSLWNDG